MIAALQRAGRIEHDHRIGQAVDGSLGRLLGLDQLAERAFAVALQPVGHGVEFLRQLRDIVRPVHARADLGVALAKSANRGRHYPERPQQAAGQTDRGKEAKD